MFQGCHDFLICNLHIVSSSDLIDLPLALMELDSNCPSAWQLHPVRVVAPQKNPVCLAINAVTHLSSFTSEGFVGENCKQSITWFDGRFWPCKHFVHYPIFCCIDRFGLLQIRLKKGSSLSFVPEMTQRRHLIQKCLDQDIFVSHGS